MLTKNEIIERLAAKGYTKKDSATIIGDVLDVITEALVKGEEVQFHGFGKFCVREMAERETTDVRTNERIKLEAYKAPKFVPGKYLKQAVREGIVREK